MDEAEIRRRLCELLGVKANASAEEIKNGYSQEAKKWHPDRVQHNPEFSKKAEEKLKDINQAYECLTDPIQFQRYGEKLAQKVSASAASRQSQGENTSAPKPASPPNPAPVPQDGSIVKIFLATGLFVLIVIVVANVTAPRHHESQPQGVIPAPSEAPGAPLFSPSSNHSTLPSDSSVGPPPGSNR